MIYFKCIRWKNLLSTGNSFTEVVFDRHRTTLIIGENGAGKSTILDALSFVLFGKPFRKVNKNQLINSINGKGTEVQIEFSVGKKEYLVKRGIKPNVFEIYCDDQLIDQNADVKEYQEMFERQILKLNHKSFSQIVILGSASFVPFMQLPSAHRRDIIEDLLDIQIFSTMHSLLKDKISVNRIKSTDVEYNIKSAADKIEMHKKYIESLKQNNDDIIAQKQAKIVEFELDIAKASAEIGTLSTTIDDEQAKITDHEKVKNKLAQVSKLSSQLETKISKIEKDIGFFEDHNDCPTCRQSIDNDHKHSIVDENKIKASEIEQAQTLLKQEYDALSERLTEISNVILNISELNKKVSNLNVQVQTWNKFIADIKVEIASLEINTKHIDDNTSEISSLKSQLKTHIGEKEELVRDKQVYDVASVMLKDSGIKTKIVRQYIPIINKLINKYLAAMDFFVNFELNENFEETIKSRFRDEFTYESFSEGEKMRIDLALLFAWRAVAKLRNSASTNLLIMDEVFDSSLDSSGTDEFLKILNGITSDTNTFIISHKGDQLFDKFDHTIKFEKHKNFSRIAQ